MWLFVVHQAFDMQRDLQITPRRLEYTREKEAELFTSLMAIANRKQEEMKEMIVETLSTMKEQLLEDAANLEFTGQGGQRSQENLILLLLGLSLRRLLLTG